MKQLKVYREQDCPHDELKLTYRFLQLKCYLSFLTNKMLHYNARMPNGNILTEGALVGTMYNEILEKTDIFLGAFNLTGEGSYLWIQTGSIYVGAWKSGECHGFGTYVCGPGKEKSPLDSTGTTHR